MNCEKGDLAVIISAPDAPENIGAFVEVVEAGVPCGCGCQPSALWRVVSRGRKLVGYNIFNMRLASDRLTVPDSCLRPIRPQADDAVDEMVRGVSCARTRTGEVTQ